MFDFAFLLVFLTKYYLGNEIKEEEMHRACDTYGGGHDENRPIAKVDMQGRAWTRLMWLRIGACGREGTFCFHEL